MPTTYTVCFSGTACSRDEGEETREWGYKVLGLISSKSTRVVSDRRIYDPDTGYIPVRVHLDISGTLRATNPSVTVRGVGENDWADQMDASDALLSGPISAPPSLRDYVRTYSDGRSQRGLGAQFVGWMDAALALQGANLAAASGADQINFIGHSRGAVGAIMAAWFLYAYGRRELRTVPVNIFAIDPVPGPGNWYGIITQLAPNVANYVGVYAWDMLDAGFNAVIPRPSARMIDVDDLGALGGTWDTLADYQQLTDPLAPGDAPQPRNYTLYACRGRHGTVAGNSTSNGKYNPDDVSMEVAPVPRLVYKLARAYLTLWGTTFRTRCRVREDAKQLRQKIHSSHGELDAMAGGETRTGTVPGRLSVRRVSSISGDLGWDTYYLEDVVGDPPYKLVYPCTIERRGGGWVKWKFL